MVWSPSQILRLGIERTTLEDHFRNRVTWINPTGNVEVQVRFTSNSNKEYRLQISLSSDFPNSCPNLVIVSPTGLLQHNGNPVPYTSNAFHTLETREGLLSICHFYPADWTAVNTLYQVFMKGRLWIEAYEGHLETGKYLDEYLGHQKHSSNLGNPTIAGQASASTRRPAELSSWPTDSPPPPRSFFKNMSKKIKKKFRKRDSSSSSDESDF